MTVAGFANPRAPDAKRVWVTPEARAKLSNFIRTPKFRADANYMGVADDPGVEKAEAAINQLARWASMQDSFQKSALFDQCDKMWPIFEFGDTEDRERAIMYVEQIMAILKIESSDGRLNRLLYGTFLERMLETSTE